MKKLRISIKEFITFYSINNLYKAKIPIYQGVRAKDHAPFLIITIITPLRANIAQIQTIPCYPLTKRAKCDIINL